MKVANKSAIAFTFVFAIVLMFFTLSSINVNAVTAPTSVNAYMTAVSDGESVKVTGIALGKTVTIHTSATGGSGNSAHYEYMYQYQAPNTSTFITIKDYTQNSSYNFKPTQAGNYTIRVFAKVVESNGTGSQSISSNMSLRVVELSNTSTINSTSVSLGDSITINAGATGGSSYTYKYTYNDPDHDSSTYYYLSPSTASSPFSSQAAITYKPQKNGTFHFKVVAKDSSTGATVEKIFTVNVAVNNLVNTSNLGSTTLNITSKNYPSINWSLSATGGKAPYRYKLCYKAPSDISYKYLVGSATQFTTGTKGTFRPTEVGNYNIICTVQDSNGATSTVSQLLTVSSNFATNSSVSSSTVTNKGTIVMNASATGGTGSYQYKYTYQTDGGSEVVYSNYSDSKTESIDMQTLFSNNRTGILYLKVYVQDTELKISKCDTFKINVVQATATDYSRQDLTNLYQQVLDWENGLTNDQRTNLQHNDDFNMAMNNAFNAICSTTEVDYTGYYLSLQEQYKKIRSTDLSTSFFLTDAANAISGWFSSILTAIKDWLTNIGSIDTDNETMNDYINTFSAIFTIFASSLIILLFGVNVISTAVQYQLFTFRGAVSVVSRLLLAELIVQMSTNVCVLIVKIFNELLTSIMSAFSSTGLLNVGSLTFEADRSGIWLVGDIIDYFTNLFPFLIIALLFGGVIILFAVLYIKLIIRSLEISMLIIVSPVFFACVVGESTRQYFQKFISAFIAVGAEIVFMAIVYIVYMCYVGSLDDIGSLMVNVKDLYEGGDTVKTFCTYIATTVACGVMMIKPPQVLRDLLR